LINKKKGNKTMATHGEVSWDENVGGGGGKFTSSKDLFMRLKNGSNEVRIITNPQQYMVHKYKPEGAQGFGNKVMCSAFHGSCPLCKEGDKAKPRWYVGVIDLTSHTYKILDIGSAVFLAIKTLKSGRWGDPKGYDIDIVMNTNNPPQSFYAVQPIEKRPLTIEEQQIRDGVDYEDLKRRVTPPTPDKVLERIAFFNSKAAGGGVVEAPRGAVQNKAVQKAPPVKKPAVEDESDEDFPSYT
jgi:hypothetical protein